MGNTLLHLRQRFPKRVFNVSDKTDLTMYKQFIDSGSWGENGCPFEVEWPHTSVPDMISKKISYHYVAEILPNL